MSVSSAIGARPGREPSAPGRSDRLRSAGNARPGPTGRLLVLALALVLLVGCKEELYSDLSERQANAMLSVLLNGGIDTVKKTGPKGTFRVLVGRADLAEAVGLLDAEGLPSQPFIDMAEMYKKEGLISSPMEERVRYMFVLSQSIAETLTNIDGVITARVHIALPENDSFSGVLKPSSASVFIKHRHGRDLDDVKAQIKRIVENSIEGLSYDHIAVFTSASDARVETVSKGAGAALVAYGPFTMRSDAVLMVKAALLTVLTLFAALVVTIVWLARKLGIVDALVRHVRRDARRDAVSGPDGLEGDTLRAVPTSPRQRPIAPLDKSA